MALLDRFFGDSCRLCGVRGVTALGNVFPTHHGVFQTKDFCLRHCRNCDVVYLDPLPSEADLRVLYQDTVQFNEPHYTDPTKVQKILEHYGNSIRTLQLVPRSGGRVLEIGAGLAWISRACKDIQSNILAVAQDVSTECAQACPWVDHYFVGALEDLPDYGPYQLVSLTHVIEHLTEPERMLERVSNLLVPNGRAYITAPFRPSGWTRGRGMEGWLEYSYLHVPAHISYFSRRWFEQRAKLYGMQIVHWDNTHEDGQAFELVLRKI